jgi:hypothetical protein
MLVTISWDSGGTEKIVELLNMNVEFLDVFRCRDKPNVRYLWDGNMGEKI